MLSLIPYSHSGCDCPAGFSGDHCEKVGESLSTGSSEGSSTGKAAFATILSICLVALVGTIAFIMIRKKRSANHMPNVETAVQVEFGPEKDFDGNELENVELV